MSSNNKEWNYSFEKFSTVSPSGHYSIKEGTIGTPVAILPLPLGNLKKYNDKVLAKAKLIAAAPDLLEALEICMSVIQIYKTGKSSEGLAIEKAESAINKATL